MFVLREYQEECVSKVIERYQRNASGTELLVIPTGGGKTVIFVEVARRLRELRGGKLNVLIVAHRDELLNQAADKYRQVRPDAVVGKVGSGIHQYGGEATVASVATISRPNHLKQLKAIGYDLVIIDEAHHVAAAGYRAVLDALPGAFVLLVTATDDRLDGKPIIGKPALYRASIVDMIRAGHLCDIRAVAIATGVSLDELHARAGDFAQDELEEVIDTPARNARVIQAYQQHAQGRRAICFCVSVAHAEHLTTACTEAGIPAGTITGATPHEERQRLYSALRDGSVLILFTVNVLTEGYDEPSVSCVIMARPTQSRALYTQCVGRGLRLYPGKEDCLLLDLTDNCLKHRLTPVNLRRMLGKSVKDGETLLESEEREKREATEHEAQQRKLKEHRRKDLVMDMLANEDLKWELRDGGMFTLEVGPLKHRIAIVPDKESTAYSVWARLAPDFAGQRWVGGEPLEACQEYAEKAAKKLLNDPGAVGLLDRTRPWRSAPVDPMSKQCDMIRKFGGDPLAFANKGEASDWLDRKFAEKDREKREKQAAKEMEKVSA